MIWHWGRRGGGPRYTLELARVLAQRSDIEVHLSLSRQSEIYADFADIPVAGRFDVDTYATLPQFALRTLVLPLLRRRFSAYLRRASIDVVFCTMDHLWNSFIVGAIHPAGCLYLLTVHDAVRHPGEDQGLRQWLLRRDVAASDGALVLTESVRELLVSHHRYPRERTFLSTLGSFSYGSRSEPRQLPADRPPRLLFFGRILDYKGLDLLLSALPRLQAEFPGLSLEIWGSGDIARYRGELAGLCGIRLENRWIAEAEIGQIFADTDLAILPYREASQSAVVATAFADGMPCIATPIPGLREQVAHGVSGLIAEGMGADELAEAIARPLRDRDLYQRLSQGALRAAHTTLDWQTIGHTVADALLRLYSLGRR
jgi:glycosyltransferase involved in cell wall biosynthesis